MKLNKAIVSSQLLVAVLIFCGVSVGWAQSSLPVSSLVPNQLGDPETVLTLPEMANPDAMIAKSIEDATGVEPSPFRFAEGHDVMLDIAADTGWQSVSLGNVTMMVWRKRIATENGVSLNFGFDQYSMPEGGQMFVYSADGTQVFGPYTSEHNKHHGQLWTPIVDGDEAIIEVAVPVSAKSQLSLRLRKASQGFVDFRNLQGQKSGSCNVDVICSQGNQWRDQIRSVARYLIDGSFFCTGAAINTANSNLDRYFLTADHCGVSVFNAPSLVFYWNFESDVCRTPGSAASGGSAFSSNTVTQNGADFLADYSVSDMTLLELEDPFPASANVFLAGWDRRNRAQTMAVAIHHPQGDEKRISFENQSTAITNYLSSTNNPNGTHIRVIDWDLGTTEPGSSGSPLFDENKRIVGQLEGGFAACSNNSSDWYGRLFRSWTGGGSNSSRLSNWLDPTNLGVQFINGINADGSGGTPPPTQQDPLNGLPWIVPLLLDE
ncbi:MAG: trypsin-like peptidase domain-containing protein [Pseudomonadota bacterium]